MGGARQPLGTGAVLLIVLLIAWLMFVTTHRPHARGAEPGLWIPVSVPEERVG